MTAATIFVFLSLCGLAYSTCPAVNGYQDGKQARWDFSTLTLPPCSGGQQSPPLKLTFNLCQDVVGETYQWGYYVENSFKFNPASSTSPAFSQSYTGGDVGLCGGNNHRSVSLAITCSSAPESCTVSTTGCNQATVAMNLANCPPVQISGAPYSGLRLWTLEQNKDKTQLFIVAAGVVQQGFRQGDTLKRVPRSETDFLMFFQNQAADPTLASDVTISPPTVRAADSSLALTLSGELAQGGNLIVGAQKPLSIAFHCSSTTDTEIELSYNVIGSGGWAFAPVTVKFIKECDGSHQSGGGALPGKGSGGGGGGGGRSINGAAIAFLVIFFMSIGACVAGYAYNYSQIGLRGMEAVPFISHIRLAGAKAKDLISGANSKVATLRYGQMNPPAAPPAVGVGPQMGAYQGTF